MFTYQQALWCLRPEGANDCRPSSTSSSSPSPSPSPLAPPPPPYNFDDDVTGSRAARIRKTYEDNRRRNFAAPRRVGIRRVGTERIMESRKRKQEEYEMQMFGFHSRAVYTTFRELVQERIKSKCKKLCKTLEKRYDMNPENSALLKSNEEQLVNAYFTAILPHLRNIKKTVNRLVSIPPNVLSEEDKLQTTQYTQAEMESMRKNLEELQKRSKQAIIMNTVLKEELQLIEQFSICTNNAERLSRMIENIIILPNNSDRIDELVKDYKELTLSLGDKATVSQKPVYNTFSNLKIHVGINIDSLIMDEEK